ncbi:MAG TPA: UbiX family flavin prenyltransferase [Candidatus Saccharimonadales bacterium]|nr:UbiX family flavin prenyltransferase [Candidatus Saccharimonadales bacterium]
MRIIVAMTGATGAIIGIRLLQALRSISDVTVDLIISKWARVTIETETDYSYQDLVSLADQVHSSADVSASIASGSSLTSGMIICPCSMKTVAGICTGYADNLILRAADVVLKERRKLILVTRETPLNEIHLQNMLALCRMGAVILPPMPAFYNRPQTINELVDHWVARVLDQIGLENNLSARWKGIHAGVNPLPLRVDRPRKGVQRTSSGSAATKRISEDGGTTQ